MSSPRPELKLDWCSHEAAKFAVERWHYSKSLPVSKLVRIGVWEGGAFIGAVVFSCGSAGVGSMGKRFNLRPVEVAELARVALTSHLSPVTRIVAIALRLLKKQCPGLRMLVSYADPKEGHLGAIYQAGNWLYTGRSSPDSAYVDKTGKTWHSRSVSETGYKTRLGRPTRAPSPVGMKRIELEPKYRYLMPMDEEMRVKLAPLAKPYPKRACESADGGTPVPTGRGGSTPTHTLESRTAELLQRAPVELREAA